jgi:hypothetical protein
MNHVYAICSCVTYSSCNVLKRFWDTRVWGALSHQISSSVKEQNNILIVASNRICAEHDLAVVVCWHVCITGISDATKYSHLAGVLPQ